MEKIRVFPLFFILLVTLIFYTSCGDASFFSTTDTSAYKITINSHVDGSIIKANENINFKITNLEHNVTSTKPDSLKIVLKNSTDGQKIADNTIEPVQLDEKLSINFKDIKTGQYQLSLILSSQDAILTETTITIFYTEGKYVINSIKSLPSLVIPDTQVLLSAELNIPLNANPYLKWSSNGVLLKKGLFKDGLAEIDWQAPKEVGVYTVTLEVFPVQPVEGEQIKYNSPLILNTELYVTSQKELAERELYPVESYFALFHFNDNLSDSVQEWKKAIKNRRMPNQEEAIIKANSVSHPGYSQEAKNGKNPGSQQIEKGDATPIGEPKAISFGKEMGYQLNETSGIHIPYLIVPTLQGNLQPFTLSMGIAFDELQPGANLVTLATEDQQFSLKLLIGAHLNPEARLIKNGNELFLPSETEALTVGQPYFISLSVFPEKDGFWARWFIDGFLCGSQFYRQSLNGISSHGKTVIGGEQGFKGIIEELGTYYLTTQNQSSIDPYLFRDAMQRKFSSSLIFANGFDSFTLPPELISEGDAYTDGINLQLTAPAQVTLPGLTVKKEPLWIFIEFSKPTMLSSAWQEKGITIKTETKPENEKSPETNTLIQTKILMLKVDTNRHATMYKLIPQENNELPAHQLKLLSEDNFSKRAWETVNSFSKPVLNNNRASNEQEFSLIISNVQSTPLYIDNILVYTE